MKTNGKYVNEAKAEAAAMAAFEGRDPKTGEVYDAPYSRTRLPCITRGRDTWYVDRWTVTENKRVHGRLMDGPHVVRERFSVGVSDRGRFKVDIGTGSGVKVEFEVTS